MKRFIIMMVPTPSFISITSSIIITIISSFDLVPTFSSLLFHLLFLLGGASLYPPSPPSNLTCISYTAFVHMIASWRNSPLHRRSCLFKRFGWIHMKHLSTTIVHLYTTYETYTSYTTYDDIPLTIQLRIGHTHPSLSDKSCVFLSRSQGR